MITLDEARTLPGKTMVGAGGEKIGQIDTLYADRDDGQPTFATVHTGSFGSRTSFMPVTEATLQGETLSVPYDKQLVHDAPRIDPDSELEPGEEERLYRHYGGVGGSQIQTATTASSGPGDTGDTGIVGRATGGQMVDDAMTRSEERLQVGTQQVEAGRARLRKFISTEDVTRTASISHEEVRIERVPITEGTDAQATAGQAFTEQEYEVVLHAEKAVVAKETVPVERVRLGTETVTEQQTVTEQVRKEQIEVEGDLDPKRP